MQKLILLFIYLFNNYFIIFYRPQNLIAQSQSGTGKTAAFVLAMLSRVDPEFKYPQVIKIFKILQIVFLI